MSVIRGNVKMNFKKNDEIEITINDIGKDGEGIGQVDGFTFFVKGALPNEKVLVHIMKLKKNYGFAKLVKVIKASPSRVAPVCDNAGKCGGCNLLHLCYDEQLKYKEKRVVDCLTRIGGIDFSRIEWEGISGASNPFFYRNKAQFPIRKGEDGKLCAGFFAGKSHRLIPFSKCYIQDERINYLLKICIDIFNKYNISGYDETSHTGLVRHIFIRIGDSTAQAMISIVINGDKMPYQQEIVEELLLQSEKCDSKKVVLSSISLNINKEITNVILGKKNIALHGPLYIEDEISTTSGDVRYQISPQSFYQVNPKQTKILYEKALEYADLLGGETVWDLYCGIGTISLFLAKSVQELSGKVFGVELVEAAVENAKKNAEINGIANAEFICGPAEEVAKEIEGDVDVVVVDPPRKGCDQKLLDTICKILPKRIVYVSCDPATLARDIGVLAKEGYELEKGKAVDMFPNTMHVETVVLLQRTNR